MHTHTIRTKFTFGDRVRFDSPATCEEATGTIVGITLMTDNMIDYLIDPGNGRELFGGILEHQITLIGTDQ